MTKHCALCGRLTLKPAVMIGSNPVGPTCARKAGLLTLSKRRGGIVSLAGKHRTPPTRDGVTKDLFEMEGV